MTAHQEVSVLEFMHHLYRRVGLLRLDGDGSVVHCVVRHDKHASPLRGVAKAAVVELSGYLNF